jgi:predicted transposase YbfD/YdcC
MNNKLQSLVSDHFAELEDPRHTINQLHVFSDILVITICAAICGADDWESVEEFGRSKEEWFATFLELPNGIPSHDTFWRVFKRLDSEQFERCFMKWMASLSDLSEQVIAIDGKQLRRSFDTQSHKAAIQMVGAWASANNLALGQVKVDSKSNEITAIPELLEALDIQGCTVTIDAMGCQTEIAEKILENGGDYLLALKENQPLLYVDVELLFDDLEASNMSVYEYQDGSSVDKDHGRFEVRQAWKIDDAEILSALRNTEKWPQLTSVVKIQAQRHLRDRSSTQVRYFLTSSSASAKKLLEMTRAHWSIENSLHWVLDMAFREDESRLRKDNGAENFAIIRRIALNLLKQESTLKLGIKNKRLKAGWDHRYLLKTLQPILESTAKK